MRVSREKAAENRERIVDTASRFFREKGFDGVGLDAIMKDAPMAASMVISAQRTILPLRP